MSRFYQTTATELQDDFIFQPDWEMAKQAVVKQDEIAGEAISTMEMMGNPLFEFDMEADGLAAERVKDMWEGTINDIARQISDISDPRELKKIVGKARRDLQKEYEFGEIRAIEDNAKKIREYEEAVKALDPSEQEFWRQHLDEYREMGGGAAIDTGKFKEQGIYDIDLSIVAFAASPFAQSIKPNIEGSLVVTDDGRWLKTDGVMSEVVSEKDVMERYQAWVKNQRGIEGRIEYGERFGEDNWRDKDGNIRFDDESFLGYKAKEGISQLAYSNVNIEDKKENSQVYLLEVQHRNAMAQQRYAASLNAKASKPQFGLKKYDEVFATQTAEGRAIARAHEDAMDMYVIEKMPEDFERITDLLVKQTDGDGNLIYANRAEATVAAKQQLRELALSNPTMKKDLALMEYNKQDDLSTGSELFMRKYPEADLKEIEEILNGPEMDGAIRKQKGIVSFGKGSGGKLSTVPVQNIGGLVGQAYRSEGSPYDGWLILNADPLEGGVSFNHFGNNTQDNRLRTFEYNVDLKLELVPPSTQKGRSNSGTRGVAGESKAEVFAEFKSQESGISVQQL